MASLFASTNQPSQDPARDPAWRDANKQHGRLSVSHPLWDRSGSKTLALLRSPGLESMRPTVQTVGSGGLNQFKLKLYRQLIVGSDIRPFNQQLDWFN